MILPHIPIFSTSHRTEHHHPLRKELGDTFCKSQSLQVSEIIEKSNNANEIFFQKQMLLLLLLVLLLLLLLLLLFSLFSLFSLFICFLLLQFHCDFQHHPHHLT
jgi:hypothetical protein